MTRLRVSPPSRRSSVTRRPTRPGTAPGARAREHTVVTRSVSSGSTAMAQPERGSCERSIGSESRIRGEHLQEQVSHRPRAACCPELRPRNGPCQRKSRRPPRLTRRRSACVSRWSSATARFEPIVREQGLASRTWADASFRRERYRVRVGHCPKSGGFC